MKILQIYKDIHPEIKGGIERYVSEFGNFLRNRGHEVIFLVARRSIGFQKREKSNGIQVIKAATLFRLLSNPVCPGFGRLIKSLDVDLIHVHLPLPSAVFSILFLKSDIPVVVTYHSDIVRQKIFLPFYAPFLEKFLKNSSVVLATSPTYIKSSRFLSELQNVISVPIGVDFEKFSPMEKYNTDRKKASRQRIAEKIPDPDNYFLFVGRFRSYKGIHVLLDAWRDMKHSRSLVMIGDGPLRGEIKKRLEKENLNVTILQCIEDSELVDYYRAAKALILPSIQRSEAFGMVQLESMACGTPVISSNLATGVSWVNRHEETGLLFEPGNSAALIEAIERMESPERDYFSKRCLIRIRNEFSQEALFGNVEKLMLEAKEHNAG